MSYLAGGTGKNINWQIHCKRGTKQLCISLITFFHYKHFQQFKINVKKIQSSPFCTPLNEHSLQSYIHLINTEVPTRAFQPPYKLKTKVTRIKMNKRCQSRRSERHYWLWKNRLPCLMRWDRFSDIEGLFHIRTANINIQVPKTTQSHRKKRNNSNIFNKCCATY